MEINIEKGVPLPPSRNRIFTGAADALRPMEIGDSVFVDWPATSVRATASYVFGKGNFATRKVEGGHRIWRLK